MMANNYTYDQPVTYQIRIQGALDQSWSDWFDGFTISRQNGETLLVGRVIDQAALHGILAKINDLGLSIVSIERFAPENE
jgi:hypothetical protein